MLIWSLSSCGGRLCIHEALWIQSLLPPSPILILWGRRLAGIGMMLREIWKIRDRARARIRKCTRDGYGIEDRRWHHDRRGSHARHSCRLSVVAHDGPLFKLPQLLFCHSPFLCSGFELPPNVGFQPHVRYALHLGELGHDRLVLLERDAVGVDVAEGQLAQSPWGDGAVGRRRVLGEPVVVHNVMRRRREEWTTAGGKLAQRR